MTTEGDPSLRLASLHRRAADQLRHRLRILEREREATRAGNAAHLEELVRLEAASAGAIAVLERAIAAAELEAAPVTLEAVEERRREHLRLARSVAASSGETRALLSAELLATSRELVGRRSRLGTPSPYAGAGQGALLDLRR